MASANPLRCPSCHKGLMEAAFFSWKKPVAIILYLTIALIPMGLYLMNKPDFYLCPDCGRKKPILM